MALWDPTTGQWYQYTPGSGEAAPPAGSGSGTPNQPDLGDFIAAEGWGFKSNTTPSSLTPVAAPGGMSGPGLVDPTNSDPQALAAQILNSQYANWESEFQPIEEQAMNDLSTNNPNVLPTAISQADAATQGVFSQMKSAYTMQNQALGLNPTGDQQAAMDRIFDVSQAAAMAGSENLARQNVSTQDQLILLGSASNPVSAITNQAAASAA